MNISLKRPRTETATASNFTWPDEKRQRRDSMGINICIKPDAFSNISGRNLELPQHLSSPGDIRLITAGYLYFISKYSNFVCGVIPKDKNIRPYSLVWTCRKSKGRSLGVSPDFEELFDDCLKIPQRFVIIPLRLKSKSPCNQHDKNSHANILILDKQKATIERFEPHGGRMSESIHFYESPELDERLAELFRAKSKSYTYLKPQEICPRKGFQQKQVKEHLTKSLETLGGFCGVWSLWYMELRLLNPNVDPQSLINSALEELSKGDNNFTKFIINYSIFIKDVADLVGSQSMDSLFENLPKAKEFFDFREKFRTGNAKEYKRLLAAFKINQVAMIRQQRSIVKIIFNYIPESFSEFERFSNILLKYNYELSRVFSIGSITTFEELNTFTQQLKIMSEINSENINTLVKLAKKWILTTDQTPLRKIIRDNVDNINVQLSTNMTKNDSAVKQMLEIVSNSR